MLGTRFADIGRRVRSFEAMKTLTPVLIGTILLVGLCAYRSDHNNYEQRQNTSYTPQTIDPVSPERTPINEDSYKVFSEAFIKSCVKGKQENYIVVSFCGCAATIATQNLFKLHLHYEEEMLEHYEEIIPGKVQSEQCVEQALERKNTYSIPTVVLPIETFNNSSQPGCPGCPVYVRGYIRSNGTYVQPYTRSYPHRR